MNSIPVFQSYIPVKNPIVEVDALVTRFEEAVYLLSNALACTNRLIICLKVCNSSLKARICVRNIEFSCSKNAALKAIRSSQRFSPRGRRCRNGENIPPISFNSIMGKSRALKFCDDELFKYSKAHQSPGSDSTNHAMLTIITPAKKR
uniref:Uncharacterized protein n=1 Tax=Glossina pallidipes TaxID=7398 RepID=A0A1A9Z0K7_GLOPL